MITEYAQIITDEASTTVTYIGYAERAGTALSAPLWAILRITQASATSPIGVSLFEWATGIPAQFANVWNDRTNLNYSA